ncbi:TetR/AcrR family transcriptional regulator [Kribbella italica]|uniref:AcrR family transcriptional regulator n=1 Tax=Kribbella italica TaxID=1540520 RepID=A0A7W9MWJ5_9ACTN|nr:TetR/AcrR family transcriptional regulator [Kribbella italica]MBB5839116.1 AcrR family transcriptional regulator [Kribbella italica]
MTAAADATPFAQEPGEPDGPAARRPGGRSARVRAQVLAAVEQELAEHGYDGLTVDGVAARSGVHRTTIYRRWKTVDTLLVDLLEAGHDDTWVPADTGTLAGDLIALNRELHTSLATPSQAPTLTSPTPAQAPPPASSTPAQAPPPASSIPSQVPAPASPPAPVPAPPDESTTTAVIAAAFRNPAAAAALTRFWDDRYHRSAIVVTRAIARQEIPADTAPDRVLMAATSPLFHQLTLRRQPMTAEEADRWAKDTAAAAQAGIYRA